MELEAFFEQSKKFCNKYRRCCECPAGYIPKRDGRCYAFVSADQDLAGLQEFINIMDKWGEENGRQ